jgi:chemotaxis protein histidine kinase CheA
MTPSTPASLDAAVIGRPAAYAAADVIAAGMELQAAGRPITGFALRKKLGGGDPKRLISLWDARQAGAAFDGDAAPVDLPPSVAEPLPADVAESLARAVEHLGAAVTAAHNQAVSAANARIEDAERRADAVQTAADESVKAARAAAAAELADATDAAEALEARLTERTAERDAERVRVEAAQAQAARAAEQVEQLAQRLGAADAAQAALRAQAQADAAAAAAKLAGAQAEAAASAAALAEIRAEAARLIAAADAARAEAQAARAEAAAARAEAEKATRLEAAARLAEGSHKLSLNAAKDQIDTLKAEVSEYRDIERKAITAAAERDQQIKALAAELATMRAARGLAVASGDTPADTPAAPAPAADFDLTASPAAPEPRAKPAGKGRRGPQV